LLPLKSSPTQKARLVAPPCPPDQEDIIDEALSYFKANVLFRNFEVKGSADLLLIYLILYITQCLGTVRGKNKSTAAKDLYALSVTNFSLPGEGGFALGGLVCTAASRADGDTLRQYLTQLRQELGIRLLDKVYSRGDAQPDKWWICFSKKKFLDMAL